MLKIINPTCLFCHFRDNSLALAKHLKKMAMQKWLGLFNIAMAALLAAALFSSNAKQEGIWVGDEDALPQVIRPVSLEKAFDFAGEALPMDNFDVRQRLDKELISNSYRHSNTMLYLKSMYQYFPEIERILKKNGLPEDFKYLAVAESGLANEVSPAGARGFWQFMAPTAKHYGLEMSAQVDERYHLAKATEAACRYLKDYYQQFGSWTLAAAAYNMGGPSLKKSLAEQKGTSYYDLNLNAETNRYVFRIVALKEIMSSPEKYGFYLESSEGYAPLDAYRELTIDTSIADLGQFAIDNGTTYRMLKVYNPWLITNSLSNPSGKTYIIRLPAKG